MATRIGEQAFVNWIDVGYLTGQIRCVCVNKIHIKLVAAIIASIWTSVKVAFEAAASALTTSTRLITLNENRKLALVLNCAESLVNNMEWVKTRESFAVAKCNLIHAFSPENSKTDLDLLARQNSTETNEWGWLMTIVDAKT